MLASRLKKSDENVKKVNGLLEEVPDITEDSVLHPSALVHLEIIATMPKGWE